jgi:tetratricopeptide (TPR) repeat protein
MIGPAMKPANFPMEILQYTDALFIMSGTLQIFWCIPMIMRWGTTWYYSGLIGTIGLFILLLITRIPNGITGLPLEDRNPMALLIEVAQLIFIGSTLIIIRYSLFPTDIEKIRNTWSPRIMLSNKVQSKEKKWISKKNREKVYKELSAAEDNLYILKKIEYGININSKDSKLWLTRGIILRKLVSNDEALQSFNEAIKLDPTDALAWYYKGLCLNLLGMKEEAKEIYQIANSLSI